MANEKKPADDRPSPTVGDILHNMIAEDAPLWTAPPPAPDLAQKNETASNEERARMFEAVLRSNPPNIRIERATKADSGEKPEKPEKPKVRELLYRGDVFVFRAIGPPTGQDRRNGVIERWQTESKIDDCGFSLIVREFYDGRFTPWSFDAIFFNDFVQAATVGVVTSILEAKWLREQWLHQQTRRNLLYMILPASVAAGFIAGFMLAVTFG